MSPSKQVAKRPLDGVKVLDLSRLFPGPYCSMTLSDFGAEVLCIEDKRFLSEQGGLSTVMRGKRHMNLNLKTEAGKEILLRLVREADVLLEGFRPGVMDRLGLSYETLKQENPRLIYCSVTGFGQSGPLRNVAGHDANYVSYGGVLGQTGPGADQAPVLLGAPVADAAAGGMNAVIGILLALFNRGQSGEGQFVDIAMLDGVVGMLGLTAFFHWNLGWDQPRGEGFLTGKLPCYGVYRCKDAGYVSLGIVEPHFWKAFCEYFEKPEWVAFQMDPAMSDEMRAYFEERFLEKDRDDWVAELQALDCCIAPVLDLPEVFDSEQVQAREMVQEIEHGGKKVKMLGIPIKLSKTPGGINSGPPQFGEHTEEVLRELGFDEAGIEQLRCENVI